MLLRGKAISPLTACMSARGGGTIRGNIRTIQGNFSEDESGELGGRFGAISG